MIKGKKYYRRRFHEMLAENNPTEKDLMYRNMFSGQVEELEEFVSKMRPDEGNDIPDDLKAMVSNIMISVAQDYKLFVNGGVEGILATLEALFQREVIEHEEKVIDVSILMGFGFTRVKGYITKLPTIQLIFFYTKNEEDLIDSIEKNLDEKSPQICGILADNQRYNITDVQEIRDLLTYDEPYSADGFKSMALISEPINHYNNVLWNTLITYPPILLDKADLIDWRGSYVGGRLKRIEEIIYHLNFAAGGGINKKDVMF